MAAGLAGIAAQWLLRELQPGMGLTVAGGLARPHGRDRSTATSGNSSGEP
jgi:hypothetical protein